MTPKELGDQIEEDIEKNGDAHVPMEIIREVFSDDTQDVATSLDDALEEFAGDHGWHVEYDDAPTPKVIFSPA